MTYTRFISEDIEALREELERLEQTAHSEALQSMVEMFQTEPELFFLPETIRRYVERINHILGDIEDIISFVRKTDSTDNVRLDLGSVERVRAVTIYFASTTQSLSTEVESTLTTLTADVEEDRGPDVAARQTHRNRLANWIRQHLVPKLKKVLGKAWQIISGLLTPKEWKVGGEIGTGVLGLAKATMEITFGSP